MDHFCCSWFVSVMLSCLFMAALWSPAGKGLTSWLLELGSLVCDVFLYVVTFPCGVSGQVWYLIMSLPDLCHLPYFQNNLSEVLFGSLFTQIT